MKIELDEPFRSLWRNGYIVTNPENRRNVCLVNSEQDRTIISYARYLMCVSLGYILSNEYEVDHIDNDKTNDVLSNLQVLTQQQNKDKEALRYIREEQIRYSFVCPECKINFELSEKIVNMRTKENVNHRFFCSQKCSLVQTAMKTISNDKIKEINILGKQNLSNYQIAKITGITAPTVKKYRNMEG